MTRKPTKISNELLFTAFCLLLATTSLVSANFNSNELPPIQVVTRAPYPSEPTYDHLVNDLLDDGQFVVSTHPLNSILSTPSLGISIKLIGPNNKITRECFLPPNTKILWPVRRLSYRTVLVQVYADHSDAHGIELVKLLLINTQNCKRKFVYGRELPVHAIFTSDDPKKDKFTLLTYGKQYCRGRDWCRLTFNPSFQRLEPLNFDFVWDPSVRVEPAGSFHSNSFVAQLTDSNTGTRRIRRYDFSTNRTGALYKELFALAKYKLTGRNLNNLDATSLRLVRQDFNWYHLISSRGLSYCWRTFLPNEPRDVVTCSRFRKDGSLLFSKILVDSNATVIQVVTTIPNGLVLFSSRTDCRMNTGECGILQVDLITRDSESSEVRVRHREIDTNCMIARHVESLVTRAKKRNGFVDGWYLCTGLTFSYGNFSLV